MASERKRSWTWAHVGMGVQFLALIRCLAEYFRLKHVQGASFDAVAAELFIEGALIASVLCAASVFAYVLRKPRWVVGLALLTVAALLVLKTMDPLR